MIVLVVMLLLLVLCTHKFPGSFAFKKDPPFLTFPDPLTVVYHIHLSKKKPFARRSHNLASLEYQCKLLFIN